jgi:hypothetical protein
MAVQALCRLCRHTYSGTCAGPVQVVDLHRRRHTYSGTCAGPCPSYYIQGTTKGTDLGQRTRRLSARGWTTTRHGVAAERHGAANRDNRKNEGNRRVRP